MKNLKSVLIFLVVFLTVGITFAQGNPYDSVPSNSDIRTVIYIKRGTYAAEKLIVPSNKINMTLIGESREETVISYHLYNCGSGIYPKEDAALWTSDNIRTAATLTVMGDGFRAENMTIENTAGQVGMA